MNRRFLDPLFFAFLFLLDVIGWAITLALKVTPQIIVVMAPAFLAMTVLALLRAIFNMEPRRFWGDLVVVTVIFAVSMGLAEGLRPDLTSLTLDFSASLMFMGVSFVSALVGLFLALVKAIPAPMDRAERQAAKAAKKEAAKNAPAPEPVQQPVQEPTTPQLPVEEAAPVPELTAEAESLETSDPLMPETADDAFSADEQGIK